MTAITFELSKAGTQVINVQDPPSYVSAVGAVGDGSTDDHTAIQACFDYVKGQSKSRHHIIYFPALRSNGQTAIYEVSKPLRVWTHTRIDGSGAIIRASVNFDWVNHPYWQDPLFKPAGKQQPGNIALMELWNDSATGRGGACRLHLYWLTLECRDQPGSIGFWGKQQQNSALIDLRVDYAETGFVTWGQQGKMERLQISGVKVGVYLGSDFAGDGAYGIMGAKFFKFEELNVEYYTVAAVRMVCDGPNWFEDSHFENLHSPLTPTARVVDCKSGEFTMEKTWSTHVGDAVIVIGDRVVPVNDPIKNNYVIRQWRNSDIGPTQIFVDDRVRNKVRMVGYQRGVEYLSGGFQNDTHIDFDSFATWWGDEGGEVRIGGTRGGTSAPAGHSGAQFTVIPNINQDEPTVRFTDSAKTLRAGVNQKGDLFLGNYPTASRPPTAGLPNGSMILDTTLHKPLWVDGGVWRDATGTPV